MRRIANHDRGVGAWLRIDAEGALRAAWAIDAARSRGEPPGPLAGVPTGLKDSFVTAGLATRRSVRRSSSRWSAWSPTGPSRGRPPKAVLARYAEGRDPAEVVAQGGYARVDDGAALSATIAAVLAANPRQLAQYRGGKLALRAYFVGLVLRETRGQADPRRVQELLDRALAAPAEPPP